MIKLERAALVWGVVGNLGGGKTMSAVALGVECMLEGYMVVSNVTFDLDSIERDYGAPWVHGLYKKVSLDDPDFDPFALPCGDPRGSGGKRRVVVVLDEVAEWIDQYSSAKDPRIKRLWSWLRHSSKRSQDIVIICQRQEYINKVVRTLIARWIWVDDMAVWKIPKLRCKLPFCGGLVMQRVYDRLGNMIGAVSWLKKSHWGRYYNTAECLNSDGAAYNSVYELPEFKYRVSLFAVALFFLSLFALLRFESVFRVRQFRMPIHRRVYNVLWDGKQNDGGNGILKSSHDTSMKRFNLVDF